MVVNSVRGIIEVNSLGLLSSSCCPAFLAYDKISEKNPSTSALTLSAEIVFGLLWKKSLLTHTIFSKRIVGSRSEGVSTITLEKRSLMPSRGNGAVTCGPHLI